MGNGELSTSLGNIMFEIKHLVNDNVFERKGLFISKLKDFI